MGTDTKPVDNETLLNALYAALGRDSDGGDQITDGEAFELKAKVTDCPPDFIDTVASAMTSHNDGYLIDGREIDELRKRFPTLAEDFLGSAGKRMEWSGTLKLFSPVAEAAVFGTCRELADEVTPALRKVGLQVDENGNVGDPSPTSPYEMDLAEKKTILQSTDFMAFACFMFESYDVNVFDGNLGLKIYQDPLLLARWKNPKNIRLYAHVRGIFDIKMRNHFDIEVLEKIGGRNDLGEVLERVRHLAGVINSAYPGWYDTSSLLVLESLLKIADDPSEERRVMAFTDPEVVGFSRFMQATFGVGIPMNDVSIEMAKKFGGDFHGLLLLKESLPGVVPPFNGGSDVDGIMRAITALEEEGVQKLIEKLEPKNWYHLEIIVNLSHNQHVEDILSLTLREKPDRGEKINMYMEIDKLSKMPTDSIFWTNLALLRHNYPDIDVGYFPLSTLISWLTNPTATKDLQEGRVKVVWDVLCDEWDIEFKKDSAGYFPDILSLPPEKMELLFDDKFRRRVQDIHSSLNDEEFESLYDLGYYLAIGPEGFDVLDSPQSRRFIADMRKLDPYFSVVRVDIEEHRRDISNSEDYVKVFTVLLESKIFGENGLVRMTPRFEDIKYLVKNDPQFYSKLERALPFLKQLCDDGSAQIPHAGYLLELIELSEIPDAAPALAGISRILGRPLVGGEKPFIGRSDDELRIAEQMIKEDGAAPILASPEFGAFCKEVAKDILTHQNLTIVDLVVLLDIYRKNGREEMEKELSSDRFKGMVAALRRDFNVMELRADMIPQLIVLSKSYDGPKIKELCSRLGIRPRTNDIPILNYIAGHPEFEQLLFDRATLESEAVAIYQKEPKFRRMSAPTSAEPEGYTERTPIGNLTNLALFRMVLLERSLRDQEIARGLGEIIARDISDKTTEYGGLLLFKNGKLKFNSVSSLSDSDTAYSASLGSVLHGGVMLFHLHATRENASDFSGPSGPSDPAKADWGHVKHYGGTGVVVTACGRVEESPNEIWVNVDMYYYNDEGLGQIADMGMYRIPLPNAPTE